MTIDRSTTNRRYPCRKESGVVKAMQFVSLRAGPFQLQFAAQQAALADLRKMVFRLLGEHEPNNNYNPDEMFFHRRAFNKVRVKCLYLTWSNLLELQGGRDGISKTSRE